VPAAGDQIKAVLRVDEPATGLHNMEVDEAMLREAEHCKSLVLRVYRWANPTLSLGHFQRNDDVPTDAAWGRIDRVTRKTGGGAIVHDRELTYSLVIPHTPHHDGQQSSEIPLAFGTKGPSEMVYRAIHAGLVSGLQQLGLNADLSEQCTCKADGVTANQSFLCFERRSPVDIVIDGVKVVGSAQRRSQFGLLQHGSVLLRRSSHAPHLAGILDFLDSPSRVEPSHSETAGKPSVNLVSRDQNEVLDSLDWEKWTVWLVKNLQVSLEKAFAGYWLFD
jgi:lipoate-protein ligase A